MATIETRLARRFLQELRPPRIRSMSDWAEQELIVPGEGPYAGLKFRFDRQPYSRLLIAEMGKWRRHNITGPVQSGKTFHAFQIPLLYHLFELRESVICGIPNLDMVNTKWKDDILPAIEATHYRRFLPDKGPGSQGGRPNEIRFKHGPRLLFMCGGGNDGQRAGATSRVLVITETEKMDEVGGTSKEAIDKVAQLEARTRAFGRDARIYMECTVTTEHGRTWRQYEHGTRSQIVCPCRHCDEWVTPEREDLVGWQDAKNKLEAGRLAKFACPQCGGCWSEEDRKRMNLAAKLLHRGQKIDREGKITGRVIETDLFGFRWNGFNNMFVDVAQLGEEEWEASHAEDPEAASLKQKLYVWCQPATADDAESIELTAGIVAGSASGYQGRVRGTERGELPENLQHLTAFIDLSVRVLQWEVLASIAGETQVIDYGFHQTSEPDVVGEEAAIEDALRELTRDLKERYPLELGLIDSSKWPDIVHRIVKEDAHQIWHASQGAEKYKHPAEGEKDKRPSPNGEPWHLSRHKKSRLWVVTYDTHIYKSRVHSSFRIRPLTEEGGAAHGRVTLFGKDPSEHMKFAKQIIAERFRIVFKPGKGSKPVWEKLHKDNHQLDCHAANLVAQSICFSRAPKVAKPAATSPQKLRVTFRMRPRLTPGA